jgi:hypothetical protein
MVEGRGSHHGDEEGLARRGVDVEVARQRAPHLRRAQAFRVSGFGLKVWGLRFRV